jgi:hypothetical protein
MAKLLIADKEIREYLFTFEICKKELPENAHPAHSKRLEYLIWQLKNKLGEDEF